ncbi:MAG: L-lactate dehydrogenase, partial [Subdoligranulum sp.]|nr:L-lactate dehydrogenase [Subdoligranulum sp.]
AMSVKRICECIVRDEKSILPVSAMIHGMYGIDGIALSIPAVLGEDGIETHVPIPLNESEMAKLHHSADTLKEIARTLHWN